MIEHGPTGVASPTISHSSLKQCWPCILIGLPHSRSVTALWRGGIAFSASRCVYENIFPLLREFSLMLYKCGPYGANLCANLSLGKGGMKRYHHG